MTKEQKDCTLKNAINYIFRAENPKKMNDFIKLLHDMGYDDEMIHSRINFDYDENGIAFGYCNGERVY